MSITLTSSQRLEITTITGAAGASSLSAVVSYVDVTSSTGASVGGVTSSLFGTTTTILAAPSSGVVRCVKNIIIRNNDSTSISFVVTYAASANILKVNLDLKQSLEWVEAGGWRKIDSVGSVIGKEATGFIDIQTYTTGGYYTWVKPTYFTPSFVRVIMWGGGGGGGGGGSLGSATATARFGGCGGGGGAFNEQLLLASNVGITEIVKVGEGGKGGKGGASAAAGSNGTDGGSSYFGQHVFAGGGGSGRLGPISLVASQGGSGGGRGKEGQSGAAVAGYLIGGFPNQGTTADLTIGQIVNFGGGGGTGGAYDGYTALFGGGGGTGHPNTLPYTSNIGGSSVYGGGGGGMGGFANATPAIQSGSAGGLSGTWDRDRVYPGAAAGTCGASPTAGGNGADGTGIASGSVAPIGGGGGGGGGCTVTANTAGAKGGSGGVRGGGGGGGGCGASTGRGGDGGDGGRGEVIVITW